MPAVAGNGLHTGLYVAMMECNHEISFSVGEPTTGDSIWCTKCYDYREVKHLAGKWGVKCNNCRYARNYGGRLSAQTKGSAHAIKFLGHEVVIWGPEHKEIVKHEPQQFEFVPF